MKRLLALALLLLPAAAGERAPAALQAEIEAMRPKGHVWRALKWRTCLLDGLAESRKTKKPVLLWLFIHNPNTERC